MHHGIPLGKSTFLVILLMALVVPPAGSADWPQFQGPNRNGVSPETGLARSWPEGGPRVLWTFSLGEGFGGPAVRDGEVFVLDRIRDKRDILRCLSLETGEELWQYMYMAPGSVSRPGSRATPTVTEKYVYVVGMLGQFSCIDRTTHKPVWQKDLLKQFLHSKVPRWGISQSPSLYGDLVVVAPQSHAASVAAFDRATGKLAWASPNIGGLGYSTPLITNLCGVDQAVMVSAIDKPAPGTVAGISLEDGTILWSYEGWQCKIPIPFATPLSDDRLFITGEYGAGSAMIQITRDGDRFEVKELFTTDVCGSQIHQPLLYENHLYMNSNGNSRSDGMVCLTLDGERLWRTRDTKELPRFQRGNLLLADGMIISLDGKTGILHLVDPSPEGYKELARAKIFKGAEMWSPMALSQGKLLLRSQKEMKCLDLRNP